MPTTPTKSPPSNVEGVFNDNKPNTPPPQSAFNFLSGRNGATPGEAIAEQPNLAPAANFDSKDPELAGGESNRGAPNVVLDHDGDVVDVDLAEHYDVAPLGSSAKLWHHPRFKWLLLSIGLLLTFVIGVSVGVSAGARGSNDIDGNVSDKPHPTEFDSRTVGVWKQVGGTLAAPDKVHKEFGKTVSLSRNGNRMAVVAVGIADVNDPQQVNLGGRVHIYERSTDNGGSYTEMKTNIYLTEFGQDAPDNNRINDCAISGNGEVVVAVDTGTNVAFAGQGSRAIGFASAYTYNPIPGAASTDWPQLGVSFSDATFIPTSVAIDFEGITVALGSSFNNQVRVRRYDVGTGNWQPLGQDISGQVANEGFGSAVSLSDNGRYLVITAPQAPNAAGTAVAAGRAIVYEWDGADSWITRGQALHGVNTNDRLAEVDLSGDGNTVAIGSGQHDNRAGHVRVYSWNSVQESWVQLGQDIDGEADGDSSGSRLELTRDGRVIAIAASNNQSGQGHVRVYRYDGSRWIQDGPDIDGRYNNDSFGASVSISGDGSTLAIGATQDSDVATTVNEIVVEQGYVEVYEQFN